jgi:hypothetical protein
MKDRAQHPSISTPQQIASGKGRISTSLPDFLSGGLGQVHRPPAKDMADRAADPGGREAGHLARLRQFPGILSGFFGHLRGHIGYLGSGVANYTHTWIWSALSNDLSCNASSCHDCENS